jgi:hypothetical protein
MRAKIGLLAKAPPVSYDSIVLAESGLLYYWPMATSAGTDELFGGRTLTKTAGTGGPNLKTGVLPNGDNATELKGTDFGGGGFFTRTGEARMAIATGMVLELVMKITGIIGGNPIAYLNFQQGSWLWWLGTVNQQVNARIHAPGGQRVLFTTATVPGPNVWFHYAMRITSTNSAGFNTADFRVNGSAITPSTTSTGGNGTPGGNSVAVGDDKNGFDARGSVYVAKLAVYSSLTDTQLTAHAHAMGLA